MHRNSDRCSARHGMDVKQATRWPARVSTNPTSRREGGDKMDTKHASAARGYVRPWHHDTGKGGALTESIIAALSPSLRTSRT
eukprot:2944181-Rhodomonas_salina.1